MLGDLFDGTQSINDDSVAPSPPEIHTIISLQTNQRDRNTPWPRVHLAHTFDVHRQVTGVASSFSLFRQNALTSFIETTSTTVIAVDKPALQDEEWMGGARCVYGVHFGD